MFEGFRRHRKTWLAGLTIMAMFAFTFPLTAYFGSDPERRNVETIAHIYGEPVTNVDLMQARHERQVANYFVMEAMVAAGNTWVRQLPPDFAAAQLGFGGIEDEMILDSLRLSHKADQFGIKITDDMISEWIQQKTGGRLTEPQFQAALRSVGRVSPGISGETLYSILRRQIRIDRVRELALGRFAQFGTGVAQVTPYEAWQVFRRLNDKVTLEAVAVPVANFTEEVADPGDAALREVYDKYVSRLPDPSSSEPGFKQPRKVQVQYATVSLDALALALEPEIKITDKEIAEYYETNKELYRVTTPAPESSAPAPGGPAEVPDKPNMESKADKPESEKASDEAAKAAPEKSKTDEPAPEKPDPTETKSETKPEPKTQEAAPQPKSDEKPNEPEPEKKPETKEKAEPDSASIDGNSDDSDELDEESQEPQTQEPAAKPAEDSKPETQETKPQTAQDPAADAERKDKPAEPKSDQPAAQTQDAPAAESTSPDQPAKAEGDTQQPEAEKKEEPKYQPLENVSAEIRSTLVRRKAREELVKRLQEVQKLVNQYADDVYLPAKIKFEDREVQQPGDTFEPPEPPDLAAEVEQKGLKFHVSELLSLEELMKQPGLGEATEMIGDSTSGRSPAMLLASADLYDPLLFSNFTEEFFVVWKIRDEAEKEPLFGDIRDEVLAAYRVMKARELAKARAEKLAESLRELDGDLTKFRELNAGVETMAIPAVSLWTTSSQLSPGSMFSPGRIEPTNLPGIAMPTEEFRQKVFGLAENEVALAANQPEDTYYVVMMKSREPASMDAFARSRFTIEAQIRQRHMEETYRQWLDNLRRESADG